MLAISGSSLHPGFIIERFMRLYYAEIVHDHMGGGGGVILYNTQHQSSS